MHLNPERPTFLGDLSPGAEGTAQTLRLMRRLAIQYKKAPLIRETALSLVSRLRPKDWTGEIRALFEYTRDHIRYVRDIRGMETVQTPPVTLELEAGDCDDKSTLLASLLESIGHPSRFVAVGYAGPGVYSHVYVEARIGSRWMPLDPTVAQPFGWAPRAAQSRMVVHI